MRSGPRAWPNAHPAPAVEEVLSRAGYEGMRVELEPTLFLLARTVLRGLLAEPSDTADG